MVKPLLLFEDSFHVRFTCCALTAVAVRLVGAAGTEVMVTVAEPPIMPVLAQIDALPAPDCGDEYFPPLLIVPMPPL